MQSWGRWLSRGLVVGGLVGLVVVAYRYGSYVTVFGDGPCERDPTRCDDRANLLAQRELGRWFLAAGLVLLAGLVATAVRRALAPRPTRDALTSTDRTPAGSTPTGPTPVRPPQARPTLVGSALTAFGTGVASVVPVVLTTLFWLFGGTAVYLAVATTWFVLLAWGLDRSRRRRPLPDGELGSLLVSGSAAATGLLGGVVAAVALAPVAGPALGASLFVLVPVALALGAGVGSAVVVASEHLLAHRWRGRSPALAAPAVVTAAVAILATGLVAGTPVGRDLVAGTRSDLYPDLVPSAAAAVPPVLPDPRPDLSFTEPPDPTSTPTPTVVASRACVADDLSLAAQGWDSAMGSTAVSVVATNTSTTPCWVRGHPILRLTQGGADLDLAVTSSPTQRWGNGAVVPDRRIGLAARGGQASFDLWWRGYRNAADQQTPQTLTVDLPGAAPVELGLAAPYLLDVVEGAEVTVTRWTVTSPGSG